MSTTKTPMPYAQAMEIAENVRELLAPGCAEIVIAGSLRRKAMMVNDVEIVVCLHDDREWRLAQSAFDSALIRAMQACPELQWDTETKRNGEKYKRLVMLSGSKRVTSMGPNVGMTPYSCRTPIDIFIAERANFGNILAIRTGNAAFSQALVTVRHIGGLMPDGLRQDDGFLWEYLGGETTSQQEPNRRRIDCPSEAAFFHALGLPLVEPDKRNEDTIRLLRDQIGGKKRRAA